ncbi:MAG: hypothetical protein ABSA46_14280 [Thermodesulfovibrionales bacterium]
MTLVLSTVSTNVSLLAVCLAVFVLYTLPGHCAVYPLFYREGRLLEGFIWGALSGVAASSLITSVIVYSIGWNMPVIFTVVVMMPLFVLCCLIWQRGIRSKEQGSFDPFHKAALYAVLILCVLFFYLPYKNLGAHVDGKYIYTWLFGHDFINRQVHVLSVSQGLPLKSYFFAGENLSYYWLAYMYPALLYKLFSAKLTIQNVIQLTSLLYSLLTASAFYLFLVHFVREKKLLVILLILTFLSYSFMDIYYLGSVFYKAFVSRTAVLFGNYSLDAFAGFSHSLYRFFLVEPQGVLAIGIVLLMMVLYNSDPKSHYTYGFFGLLLGSLFGIEATMGIMLALWFISVGSLKIWLNRHEPKQVIREHFVAGIAAGVIYLCLFAIKMYSLKTGQGVLQMKPNMFPILLAPLYFPIEYGPVLLFGIAGMVKVIKQKENGDHWIYQFIILLIISLFFVFFIVNPAESQFGLLKATRIIPLCLLMLTAYLWQRGLSLTKFKWPIVALLVVAAPTYFTDMYIASNVKDTSSTYIRDADFEACQWIKRTLPVNAVIQAEPNYPGIDGLHIPYYYYSLIPDFAERVTGVGEWKVSNVEHSKAGIIGERFHEIKKMFSTTDLSESVAVLKKYHINYVYIGRLENLLYPQGISKFRDNQGIFKRVYSMSGTEIYEVTLNGNERRSDDIDCNPGI